MKFYESEYETALISLLQEKGWEYTHGRQLRDRMNEILFMDLRQWTSNAVKGEQKKKVVLSAEQIRQASNIYFTWQSVGTDGATYAQLELYRSVGIDELRANDFTLVPSRYIEFVDRDSEIDYHQVLTETATSVSSLLHRQQKNDNQLRQALKHLGYECK